MSEAVTKAGVAAISSEITMLPQNYVTISDEAHIKGMQRILDILDEDDDVQNVYNNWSED